MTFPLGDPSRVFVPLTEVLRPQRLHRERKLQVVAARQVVRLWQIRPFVKRLSEMDGPRRGLPGEVAVDEEVGDSWGRREPLGAALDALGDVFAPGVPLRRLVHSPLHEVSVLEHALARDLLPLGVAERTRGRTRVSRRHRIVHRLDGRMTRGALGPVRVAVRALARFAAVADLVATSAPLPPEVVAPGHRARVHLDVVHLDAYALALDAVAVHDPNLEPPAVLDPPLHLAECSVEIISGDQPAESNLRSHERGRGEIARRAADAAPPVADDRRGR